jgi:hypothetical protein
VIASGTQHMRALQALYGPAPDELRAIVSKGMAEALRQVDAMQTDQDLDRLLAQLHGCIKTAGRLRGQLPIKGAAHARTT